MALRRVRWSPAPLFAVAALPALWAAVETAERGEHVPASLERQLPIGLSLGNLCPGAESDPELVRRLRRQTDVLIRELAEEQLADIESGGPRCVPELERRTRAAL